MNISEEKIIQILDQTVIFKKRFDEVAHMTSLSILLRSFDIAIWINGEDDESINSLANFLEVSPKNITDGVYICHNGVKWQMHFADENTNIKNCFIPKRDLQYLEIYEELFIFMRKIITLTDSLMSIMIDYSGVRLYFYAYSKAEKLKIINNMPKDVSEFKVISGSALTRYKTSKYNYKGAIITLVIKENYEEK